LVGVYDGDSARVGRVVVDSTWHHWLSMNLYGFRHTRPRVYELMQAYFRNVALWLARRNQRAEMLYAAIWGAMTGASPMKFHTGMSTWRIGEVALDVIGRTASQCLVFDLTTIDTHPEIVEAFFQPAEADRSAPANGFSPELFNRAIVGGIAAALIEPAQHYRDALDRGERPRVDGAEIAKRAAAGAKSGYGAFVDAMVTSKAESARVRKALGKSFAAAPADLSPAPFAITAIRVVAERLQFSNPSDPALADGRVTLTVRVRIDDTAIAAQSIEDVKVPELSHRNAPVDLSRDLGRLELQSGDRMTIEVTEGSAEHLVPGSGPARFSVTLDGDPSGWIRTHRPDGSQDWRLWYRVEAV
jgi:hypothetical protein